VAVADDLDEIENGIRRLQIEWDKFFSGVDKKPPTDARARLEAFIRRYAGAELRNNTERFRFQTLQARYNTFNELWSKRLRAMEEGRIPGLHGRAASPALTPSRAPAAASAAPEPVRLRDPGDADAVRDLFDRFLQARRAAGEDAAVRFESFQKLIAEQASRILTEKGAQAVDFRLETKDGKVSVKAKPVR
jgi:hypothetical protein